MSGLLRGIRAGEWWEHKLGPILGSGYATAFLLGVPLTHLLPVFLRAIIALVPGAVYASLLNDLTDVASDRAAGKPLGLAGSSRPAAVSYRHRNKASILRGWNFCMALDNRHCNGASILRSWKRCVA